jgi:hypothetical protein
MPSEALLLVLVAALLHALWNIAAKKAGGGDHFVLMVALLIVALWAPLALIARGTGPLLTALAAVALLHERLGVLIAGYTVIGGYAVKLLAMSPILVDYFGNAVRIPFMLPAALRNPLAYVLALYAVRIAPLSHVVPARELSMLFAALLGGKLLGEGDRGQRVAGAPCIALGVAALALG